MTAVRTEASLYDGVAGDLAALRMLARSEPPWRWAGWRS